MKGHQDRNIYHEIQRQKALEKGLGCQFIKIDPYEEISNIFKAIIEIHRHIKKSTKKSTEKSSNNSIKTKCLKYFVKKILPAL